MNTGDSHNIERIATALEHIAKSLSNEYKINEKLEELRKLFQSTNEECLNPDYDEYEQECIGGVKALRIELESKE